MRMSTDVAMACHKTTVEVSSTGARIRFNPLLFQDTFHNIFDRFT